MTVLGPLPCIRCGRTVAWDRVGSSWRLMEGAERHDCPGITQPKPELVDDGLCGAWMRNVQERCARRRGHADHHRRRLVMDDEAARRRSIRLAA